MKAPTRKKQYLQGLRAGVPVIFGFVPVGIAYAIMARRAGFSVLETVYMSLSVFAGASQMMAVGLYVQGAGILAMILATFIINLRHVIMGTCIMEKMPPTRPWMRWLLGFGVTDEAFAIFTTEKREKRTPWYFLGLTAVTYASWVAGSAVGAVVSDLLPDILTASLGIALYAMFIGLLVPGLTRNGRLALLVVFTAVVNTFLSRVMDSNWALIVSTLASAALGVFFVDLGEETEEEGTQ
ncbi:MAG: AzlC family ABC transporter permease [Clostridia bacterium]|nr:AzlC family ABC transporter permease [Clostridia bacterium]